MEGFSLKNIRGMVGKALIALLVLAVGFSAGAAAAATKFKDVNRSMWTYDMIHQMDDEGIIKGYPDNTFKPQKAVSRGQVAVMLDRALELDPIRPSKEFKDVPKSHMYYDEIQAVYRAGIFDGTNGNFRPAEPLSRAQMAKVISIAFDLEPKSEANLSDVKGLWVEDYVNAMYTNGITTGTNGKYLPNNKVTREHYAAFLYRALNKDKDGATPPVEQEPTLPENPKPTTPEKPKPTPPEEPKESYTIPAIVGGDLDALKYDISNAKRNGSKVTLDVVIESSNGSLSEYGALSKMLDEETKRLNSGVSNVVINYYDNAAAYKAKNVSKIYDSNVIKH